MPTILVVDDSAFDRQLAARILTEGSGFEVETVDNGRAALARIAGGGIDTVVTDLQMPELDGLELVRTIRSDYPGVPVILMTAVGSEAIAMDALRLGAASYVPKRLLNQRLVETVQNVVSLAQSEQAYGRLISQFNATQFSLSLDNQSDLLDTLVDYIQQIAEGVQLCFATERLQLGMAVKEALLNAQYHGNLELTRDELLDERERMMTGQASLVEQRRAAAPYCDRKIHFTARIGRDEARFVIRDEGNGFDAASIAAAGDQDALEKAPGRGLILMQNFVDEIVFNDVGNEVILVKRREDS